MTIFDQISLFDLPDAISLSLLLLFWVGLSRWIERDSPQNQSVTIMMTSHRRTWMQEMQQRDNRIFDAQIAASLRQGTSFMASTALLSIGGVIALVGSPAPLAEAAEAVGQSDPIVKWQIKLFLVALLLSAAFLRFIWANRLFGYTAVLMAAVPGDMEHPEGPKRAAQAAEMNIRAALNFNKGLRSIYFAIAALAWLAGPWMMILATLAVAWVIWQREFRSAPHRILKGTK